MEHMGWNSTVLVDVFMADCDGHLLDMQPTRLEQAFKPLLADDFFGFTTLSISRDYQDFMECRCAYSTRLT